MFYNSNHRLSPGFLATIVLNLYLMYIMFSTDAQQSIQLRCDHNLETIKTKSIPRSAFYPLIRLLSPHPPFIPSSAFYSLIRRLSPHPPFIPSSAFYLLIRFLSHHLPFIPLSAFYPPIRRPYAPSHPPSVSAFYPNP